jgi:hypothetical protein
MSMVPQEAAAILESTFQRILAESTFADVWTLPTLSDSEALDSTELKILMPLTAPWRGTILIGATEATAKDLAAGFHSLPDTMVDRGIALDFLAELAEMLARDIFCASEISVQTQEPTEPSLEQATSMWSTAAGSRTAQGCNGAGRMIAALVPNLA